MSEELTDKKAAILQATLELISEQGLEGTPMSQIAQRANTGVGTIYRYFPSKTDLINALYIEIKKQLTQRILSGYDAAMPVRKAFKLALRSMTEYFITNADALQFAGQYLCSPLITAETHREGIRIFEPVNRLLVGAAEQELLKPMPQELMGELIFSSVASLARYYQRATAENYADPGLDAGIDAIWDMISI